MTFIEGVESSVGPIVSTLRTVPAPMRSLRGIQSNKTPAPVMIVMVPIVRPVWIDAPSWNTCQGFRPSSERTMTPMPTP